MNENNSLNNSEVPSDGEKLPGYDVADGGKKTFGAWLDNYLYHYKWHTIVALFVVFAIVICSFQMCSRTSYDAYIMYAGGREIKKTAESGSSDYEKMLSALMQYTEDFDSDGAKNVSFLNLFIPSAEQIAEIEANKKDTGLEVNYSLIAQDTDTFEQYIIYGEYYLVLLSEDLFLSEDGNDAGLILFMDIEPYTNGRAEDYEYIGERGIYLRSTELYKKAGFCDLPDDTVIALRAFSQVAANVGKKKNAEIFSNSEKILTEMLKDG